MFRSLMLCATTLVTLAIGCGRQEISVEGNSATRDDIGSYYLATENTVSCPAGSSYDSASKFCVNANHDAIGPFPKAMIDLCVAQGGGKACQTDRWDVGFAKSLRGSASCPRGTQFDLTIAQCLDGDFAYGPFTQSEVNMCKQYGGGKACDSMRWGRSLFPAATTSGSVNRQLLSYYSQYSNYQKVYSNVMGWFGTTSNGCVAFMSTALRMVGVKIDQGGVYHGEAVSLVTLPFSEYLQEQLHWKKITNANDLQPGDVVLSIDDANYPGYPAHTYMFQSWSNKSRGTGLVVDNQAFTHERNIFGYADYNFSPFAYALRSP